MVISKRALLKGYTNQPLDHTMMSITGRKINETSQEQIHISYIRLVRLIKFLPPKRPFVTDWAYGLKKKS